MSWARRVGLFVIFVALISMVMRRGRSASSSHGAARRVWMFNHYAVTPEMAGGTRHHELASLLPDHGWEATIFATPYSHHTAQFVRSVALSRLRLRILEGGVDFVWLYTIPYRGNDWRRYVNMVSFLAMSAWAGLCEPRPDVVLGSSPHLLSGLAGWLVAKWHRVPFVLEVRDLWPDTLVDMGLSNPAILTPLKWLERLLYREAVAIVALSESIRAGIIRKGVASDRVTFIPNATMRSDIGNLSGREHNREALGWSGKTVFIYAGAHGAANALDQIIAAAAHLEHEERVLIALMGDGPEKPGLEVQAAELENVVFLDSLPRNEVQTVLSAADVGVLTLRKSQVFAGVRPNKLFDYFAAGLPIITTVPGETWGIVRDAEAGLFAEPDDPVALAEALRRLATDSSMRQRMTSNARKCGGMLPTREQTAVMLSNLLDGVAREPTGSTAGIAAS